MSSCRTIGNDKTRKGRVFFFFLLDEESYAKIAAGMDDHLMDLYTGSITTLMSGENEKDLKNQYEIAAAAAATAESKGGSTKWPEVKRMWKVTKDNCIVYAVVEYGT